MIPDISGKEIKIGTLVFYTAEGKPIDPRSGKEVIHPTFPAIIYKVLETDRGIVGLYVFTDDGLRLMRSVYYSVEVKPETWRFNE